MKNKLGSALVWLTASTGLLAAAAQPIDAGKVRDAHAEVELVADAGSVPPGGEFRAGVRFKLEPGWHIYGQDPGDAGMPTRVKWQLPDGVTAGPLEWPEPEKFVDPGNIVSYGYKEEVLLEAPIRAAASVPAGQPLTIRASVRWLSCREICEPGKADLALALKIKEATP